MSEATTKGTILRSLVRFIQKDLTDAERERAIAALPPEDRELVQQPSILPTQRISEFTLNRYTAAAAAAKGEPLEAFGRRAGRAELADAVGVYRFLTMVLTPTALLRKASTLWGTIHSNGSLTVDSQTSSSAVVRLSDFPSEEAHCARISGWFEGAGDMTHSRDISVVHSKCMVRGDHDCIWDLAWR